ncbi:MAG: aspartyl protease family protein, partial [Nitrospinota bacterium]|nr:aspartyl protease family protein [Nitrospinota bacterium]
MTNPKRILSYVPILLGCALIAAASVAESEVIKWTDAEGNLHYSDSVAEVPAKYRSQIERKVYKFDKQKETAKKWTPPWKQGNSARMAPPAGYEQGQQLKRFSVPYRAFEGTARRIIIDVTFNGSVTAPMLLDTGAPGVVISEALANRIGVFDGDTGKLRIRTGGIGGSTPAILTIIDRLEVGEGVSEFVPVKVTHSLSRAFEGLVGMDFMANFQMTIDNRRHLLLFQEMPESDDRPGGHDEHWWRALFYNFARMRAGWGNYMGHLKSANSRGSDKLKFAESQYSEADKLLRKLDSYAAKNSVP